MERFITDSYEPFNILALSQDDDHVVLSSDDFEKLLACRDMIACAWHSKKDLPYRFVEETISKLRQSSEWRSSQYTPMRGICDLL